MAITILPKDEQPNPFGNSLSSGLQMLAQQKLMQVQQRQQARGLQALGIPAAQASSLAMLPQDQQIALILSNDSAPSLSFAGLEQALGGSPVQAQQQFATSSGQQPEETQNKLANVLNRPRLKPEHRLKVEALKQQKEALGDKETLPVYKDIIKGYKAAHESEKSLDRMEKLIDSGRLSNPKFHSLLKTLAHGVGGFGIDLHSLESPESQEFTKLTNSYIKQAKDVFGGRVTDADLKAFLSTLPTLSQSDEGKRRIINVLRSENKAAKIKKEALDQILKENKGKRPANLDLLIEERVGSQLDDLAKNFAESMPSEKRSFLGEVFHTLAD